jgi:hypothetical protein
VFAIDQISIRGEGFVNTTVGLFVRKLGERERRNLGGCGGASAGGGHVLGHFIHPMNKEHLGDAPEDPIKEG